MAMTDKGHYRRDVDGLRGLAILCVALFHATGSLEGGFIGVDVFFVISGFLITGILLREVKAGKLSLAAFGNAASGASCPPRWSWHWRPWDWGR